MILSDSEIMDRIAGRRANGDAVKPIVIRPTPDSSRIQPASIDLSLGAKILSYHSTGPQPLEPGVGETLSEFVLESDEPFILMPDAFVLGHTEEWIEVPDDLVARVEGKSSLGRMGLVVHVTAGFIDPGFRGNITLELCNLNCHRSIALTRGMLISQLAFESIQGTVRRPYGHPGLGSKYQDSRGVKGAACG